MENHIVPLYHLELVRDKDLNYRDAKTIVAAAEIFHEMLDSSPVEKLAVIYVNLGGKMIGAEYVAMGSLEKVSADMSDLFRGAIKIGSAHIWLAHNHVDGDVRPSLPDYRFTMAAVAAGKILNIEIMDHLVVGPGAYHSINRNQNEMSRALERDMHAIRISELSRQAGYKIF